MRRPWFRPHWSSGPRPSASPVDAGADDEEHDYDSDKNPPAPHTSARLFDQSLFVALWWGGRCRSEDELVDSATISGTMVSVKVDRNESVPLHDQVAADIRRAIAEGEARPGERLPPAKDLAAVLGVNTNTVLRALRLLRDEGLLEFRRGKGISVAGTPERSAVLATARARELVQFARGQGFRRDELIEMIEGIA